MWAVRRERLVSSSYRPSVHQELDSKVVGVGLPSKVLLRNPLDNRFIVDSLGLQPLDICKHIGIAQLNLRLLLALLLLRLLLTHLPRDRPAYIFPSVGTQDCTNLRLLLLLLSYRLLDSLTKIWLPGGIANCGR